MLNSKTELLIYKVFDKDFLSKGFEIIS